MTVSVIQNPPGICKYMCVIADARVVTKTNLKQTKALKESLIEN